MKRFQSGVTICSLVGLCTLGLYTPLALAGQSESIGSGLSSAGAETLPAMTRRVVLDDPRMDTAHMSIESAARLTGWLAANGFRRLNGDTLADFLRDRIRGGNAYGSVAVLSRGMAPMNLLEGPPKQPLWLEYLRAGGRIVNVGAHPFYYCQYPTSRPPLRDQAARGLTLLNFHLGWDSPYWGQALRVTPNPAAKPWGLEGVGPSVTGFPVETVTLAFGLYTVPNLGKQGAADWFKNVRSDLPWSGLVGICFNFDAGRGAQMRDVWRAANYVGSPVTVPPLPASPARSVVRMTASAAGFSGRHEFVRGESVNVDVQTDPSLKATAVRLELFQPDRALVDQRCPLTTNAAHFTIATAPYAYGAYTLKATALVDGKPVGAVNEPFGIRYIPPEGFNWEMSVSPGPNPVRTEMEYANIAAAGLELYAGGQEAPGGGVVGMDAAIRHGMGFSLRINPDLTGRKPVSFEKNREYYRIDHQDKPIGNAYTAGRPGLGISHPDIRANLRKQMEVDFRRYAQHPAVRPYCLLNDDWSINYGWDYAPHVLADFRARTGRDAPRKMKLPQSYGAIADDDPWIQWFKYCLLHVGGAMNKAETEGALAGWPEVRVGPIPGGMQIPLVMLWQPSQYPPYNFGSNGFNLIASYYYNTYWQPVLTDTFWMEIGRMGNRDLPEWCLGDCFMTGGYTRNNFYHFLAGGLKGLAYYTYRERNAETWSELKRLGSTVRRVGPVQSRLEPAPRDIGLLNSFTTNCFDPGHTLQQVYAYHNLLQGHFDLEPTSEDEIVAGRAGQYKAVLLYGVKYLQQKVYDALAAYAAHGGLLILDSSVPFEIPGAKRLAVDIGMGRREPSSGPSKGKRPPTPGIRDYGHADRVDIIRQALSPYVKPRFDSPEIKLVASRFEAEGVPYTWFVNSQDGKEYMFCRERMGAGHPGGGTPQKVKELIDWENAETAKGPYVTTVEFDRLPGVPYDLVRGAKAVVAKTASGRSAVTLSMERFGGALIAWLPSEIAAVTLAGPQVAAPNQPVRFQATISGTDKPMPGAIAVEFLLRDPKGRRSVVSGVRTTRHGQAVFDWTPAVNDPTGSWTLDATELASGKTARCTIDVSPSDLERGFVEPPLSAQPRVYWWWLESNLDRAGITRDLEEMKRKGIGGALIFDASSGARYSTTVEQTPGGPPFMSPAWRALFKHALQEADRLGLEISLNMSSGWDCGGPWVTPEDASQRLVWSETTVAGPAKLSMTLPIPSAVRKDLPGFDPYYRDVAVLAVPESLVKVQPNVRVRASSEEASWPAANAADGDLATLWVSKPVGPERFAQGKHGEWLELEYPEPRRASALFIAAQEGYGPYRGELECRNQDGRFTKLAKLLIAKNERLTVTFPEVRSSSFRLLLWPGEMDVDKIHNLHRSATAGPRVRIAELLLAPREEIDRNVLRLRSWRINAMNVLARDVPADVPAAAPAEFPQDHCIARSSVIDLSGRVDRSGRLDWEVPPGRWSILRFGRTPTGVKVSMYATGGAGLMLDHLSPEAMDLQFANTAGKLLAEAGPLAGKSLKYLHCDSWELGLANWTPRFTSEFRRRRGYDPLPYLPALAGKIIENREVTDRFCYDFRKTVGDCIADNHYGRFRELAHRRGVQFHPESGGGDQVAPFETLKCLGRADIPMGEFWAQGKRDLVDREPIRALARWPASAAHLYGSRLVNAEAFTSLGPHWEEDPLQLKPLADCAFCEGVNRFFFHTFTHSPVAAGKPGYEYYAGTHFNPQITWWEQASAWTQYIARCQFLLQQGRFVADVCYYYGDQVPNNMRPKPADPSLGPGYDYDVTNAEAIVSRMSVHNGRIVLPDGMNYRMLVLPERETIDLEVLRKVADLVKDGATVVGPKPLRATGLRDYPRWDRAVCELADTVWGNCDGRTSWEHRYGRGRVICGKSPRECLRSEGVVPDFEFHAKRPDTEIGYLHRICDGTEIYFVANRRNRWEEVNAAFRIEGKAPELWDPATSERLFPAVYTIDQGRTALPLRLEPFGSVFVVFRSPAAQDPIRSVVRNGQTILPTSDAAADERPCVEVALGKGDALELKAWQPGEYLLQNSRGRSLSVKIDSSPSPRTLPGPWTVHFPAGWGAPSSAVFQSLESWTKHAAPGIKYFSGTATYKKAFDLTPQMLADGRRVVLDLGEVRNLAEVRLNGKNLGVLWKRPFRLEITEAARPGCNSLEVDVTNLWPNRLIGDQFLAPEQRFARTNVRHFTKDSPLSESGLLGPVQFLTVETRRLASNPQ